jgi:hypothetical protein
VPELVDIFDRFKPRPDPCLTCPPWDLIEIYVLGGITRHLLDHSRKLEDDGDVVDEALIAEAFVRGAADGGKELLTRSPPHSRRRGSSSIGSAECSRRRARHKNSLPTHRPPE